jgi:homopolymeric O-antigen transport system permease protein
VNYFKELLSQWELLYFFCRRDLLVRYKQTLLGVSWAVFRPLLNMLVFAFIFGNLAALPSDGAPYFLFVLAGLLPWQFFANAINETTTCFIYNPTLITKVYFLRMILPLSNIFVQLVDFGINLVLFLLLGFPFLQLGSIGWLPLAFLLLFTLVLGTSLWLSALTVSYRDIRHIVPFAIQFGMLVSPVGYGSFILPEGWSWLYRLNPLVGIIDGFRLAFFGVAHEGFYFSLGMSAAISLLIFISGIAIFRKFETSFADTI